MAGTFPPVVHHFDPNHLPARSVRGARFARLSPRRPDHPGSLTAVNVARLRFIDYYAGATALVVLKPFVMLAGRVLQRDHDICPRGDIVVIKMLGGGSLVVAYPALLGLRRRYPTLRLRLVCTPTVAEFARTLGIFDDLHVIDDNGLARLAGSSLNTLRHLVLRADTVIDLEVHSRLTTALSVLTMARNRIGFYLQAAFWRRNIHTHLVFFNVHSGAWQFYERIALWLDATPASAGRCEGRLRDALGPPPAAPPTRRRVALGHGCSDLAPERMLTPGQWESVLRDTPADGAPDEIHLLGAPRDRERGERIAARLASVSPGTRIINHAGSLTLPESLNQLAVMDEYWGIDSALLHYARLLGLRCRSWWGPTNPATLLKPRAGLREETNYLRIACSPCVHVANEPPCGGDNVCIAQMFDPREARRGQGFVPVEAPRDRAAQVDRSATPGKSSQPGFSIRGHRQ